jgi:hypothetical protein
MAEPLSGHLCESAYWKSRRISRLQRYAEKAENLGVEMRQSGQVFHDQDALSQETGMGWAFWIHCRIDVRAVHAEQRNLRLTKPAHHLT